MISGDLSYCDPTGLLQSPRIAESRKYQKKPKMYEKMLIPHRGLAPENTKKNTPKKFKNGPKCWAVCFGIFFVFRGQRRQPVVGNFVFFLLSLYVLGSVAGPQDRNSFCIYQSERGKHPHQSASAEMVLKSYVCQVRKNSLNIKFLGGIFLGHPGPRRRDIPDKNFMQVAFFCCFRQGVAGMFRDLGRDVPDLEKLSDSVKRHLSVVNLKFDFISDGGCTREEQIALSLQRHLFPHGGREPKAFWICFPTLPPILNISFNF